MPNTWKIFAVIALSSLVVACSDDQSQPEKPKVVKTPEAMFSPKVVYGEDHRLDLYQVEDAQILEWSKSTVGLVKNNRLRTVADGSVQLTLASYRDDYRLCPSEPFFEQKTGAFCSGFLVAPKIIITAGHCIRSQNDCSQTSFVFDFAIKSEGDLTPSKFNSNQVFNCTKVLASTVVGTGADFAIVEIDREVTDRAPLKLRSEGIVQIGEPLFVVGHPAGLPTKVAGGATVREVLADHFVSNLDTYGGNSGSAVFNSNSGEVEGILVRGETDYKLVNGCYVSYTCTDDGCRGEDVTRIDKAVVNKMMSLISDRNLTAL